MKSAFALIAAAGLVAAQNFDSLPACAVSSTREKTLGDDQNRNN